MPDLSHREIAWEIIWHIMVMLIVAAGLGVIGWIAGTHGYVLSYWFS